MNLLPYITILTLLSSFTQRSILPGSQYILSKPNFISAIGDTVEELGNNIMLVYQDKKNRYWFGSWETGLYSYNPSTSLRAGGSAILHYTSKHGFPHNRIDEIKEDHLGNVYFNTPEGVIIYDGQSFTPLPISRSNDWKLEPNDIWFKNALPPGHACRYDGTTLHILTLPTVPVAEKWIADHPRSLYPNMGGTPYDIYTVYKDSHGNIWFGTAMIGACRYNGITHDWISEEDVTEMHNGPSNGIRSIIEDKDGHFWFNSMYCYEIADHNAPGQPIYKRVKSIGNLDGMPDSDFWEYMSIARDNQDELWIATYGNGVWHYDGSKTIYYPVQNNGSDITLYSIYKDNEGSLWLGTHEHGAYKFNGTTFEKWKP